MFLRKCLPAALSACLIAVIGCGNPQGLDSIQVSPASQSLTVGQTAQLTATGTYGNASHPSTQNVTGAVTWTSSAASVATVNAAGLVTAVGAGSTTITATAGAFNGPVTSSAAIVVTSSGSGGTAGGVVVSLAVIPGSQTVSAPGQTAQFIAVGTTSSGATVNLTNQVQLTWSTSSTAIATIGGNTGLATAVGAGTATITAVYSVNGTVVTGTAAFIVSGGTAEKYTGVTIIPNAQSLSSLNQTGQFIALATAGSTGLQTDVTNSPQIKWSSSASSIAPVNATGQVTNLGAGTITIAAELTNPDNTVVSNTATLTTSLTAAPQDLLSLTIIPSSSTVGNLQSSAQFLAIGTFATAPTTRDLTNSVQWISSFPNDFPVTTNCSAPGVCSPAPVAGSQNGGVASAYADGNGVIIAEAKGSDGSIQTATATFACPLVEPNLTATPPVAGSCYPGSQASSLLSTLTVYNEGLNNSTSQNWVITASSATGTANVIHCGPGWTGTGGSVCTATYPLTTTNLLIKASGGSFGGWSVSTCIPSDSSGNPLTSAPYYTAAGPNYCVIPSLATDETVGAIFN